MLIDWTIMCDKPHYAPLGITASLHQSAFDGSVARVATRRPPFGGMKR
jgi:hypothetical protein